MGIFSNHSDNKPQETAYSRLYCEVKRLCALEIEKARLILAEKLTLLFGQIALVAIAFVVGTVALIFLSMSLSDFLLKTLEPCWTYLIVAGFYLLMVLLVVCFRRKLIIDPIARYISRLIVKPPTHNSSRTNTTNNSTQAES